MTSRVVGEKMQQINPPFDGSAACPMCPQEIRAASAYVHNFLVRWPEGKAFSKLFDLRSCRVSPETEAGVTHPAVKELVEVIKALQSACEGMTLDRGGGHIRWTKEIKDAVEALVPRAEKAMYDTQGLTDEHFNDERHCSGRENVLREQSGSVGIRFLPKYDYDYTVEVVNDRGDLEHRICSTHLKLHQHFKDRLSKDPTFYAKVWCPVCRINAPFNQFFVGAM